MNKRITRHIRNGLVTSIAMSLLALQPALTNADVPTNGDELIFRAIASDSYVIHQYTTVGSSTFAPPDGVEKAEYLIVAGGGSGGWRGGNDGGAGGGGAGGLLTNLGAPLTIGSGPYAVIVGKGGDVPAANQAGRKGDASSIFGFTAEGGGGGGIWDSNGGAGGSGGGAASRTQEAGGGGGTGSQGNDGGSRGSAIGNYGGAGGGGAGSAGENIIANLDGRAGGDGALNTITGENIYYAGGGGGGAALNGSPGPGGIGGGGDGHSPGTDGLGGGGGGGSRQADFLAGAGGSGVVIVRYKLDEVTGWNTDGYYALPNQGVARSVLIDDSIAVKINDFSILQGGTLLVGDGAGLAVDGSLALGGMMVVHGALNIGGQVNVAASGGVALKVGPGFYGAADVDSLFNNTFAGVSMAEGSLVGIDTTEGDFTYSTPQAGSRGLVKLGANTLTITGANSYTGPTVVAGGTLALDGSGTLPNGAVILSGDTAVLDISGISADSISIGASSPPPNSMNIASLTGVAGSVLQLGAKQLNIGDDDTDATFAFDIAGAGSLIKSGTGTLTLAGTNTYAGDTLVNAGTIKLDGAGTAVPGNLVLSGGNVIFNRNNQIADTADVTITAGHLNSTAGTATDRRTDHTETIGSLTVTGGSFQTGVGGQWTITGDAQFTGGEGGTKVVVSVRAGLGFGGLTLTNVNSTTVSTDNSFSIYSDNAAALTTVSVGAGGLVLNDSRILARKGSAANHQGFALILDGNLNATGASAIQLSTTGTYSYGAGELRLSSTAGTFTRTLNVDGDASQLRIEADITNGAATSAGIVKTGGGSLVLTGTNTYTGGTTVAEGVLAIQSAAALPGWDTASGAAAGGFTMADGTILVIGAGVSDTEFNTMRAKGNFAPGAAIGVDTSEGNRTFAVDITGAVPLVKLGPNTLTLSGTNDYSGGTTVAQGVLTIDLTNALPGWDQEGSYSVADGAVLAVGNGVSVADFNTMRTLTGNYAPGAAIGLDTSAGARTISAAITGGSPDGLALAKVGSADLTLTANNTYTGLTVVREGALLLDTNHGLHGGSARAIPGDVVIDGGSLRFAPGCTPNQIADHASVTVISGHLNSTSGGDGGRRAHTETLANLTLMGGTFQTGRNTTASWNITGDGVVVGGTGVRVLVNDRSTLRIGSLTLTDLTSTGSYSNNSFTIQGHEAAKEGTLWVGAGGLTLNNSRILMRKGNAVGHAGAWLVLDGDVTATGTSAIQIISPATYSYGAGDLRLSSAAGTFTRTFDVDGGHSHLLISADITNGAADAAGIRKTGLGMLTLAGTNTYTGGTEIVQGILEIVDGGSLVGNVVNHAELLLNRSDVWSFAGSVSGMGTLTKLGPGTVTLTGTNTYTGATSVQQGVLTFGNVGARPDASEVDVTAGTGLALAVKLGDPGFFDSGDIDALFARTFANVAMADGALVGIDTTQGDFTYGSDTPAVHLGLVKVGPNTLTLTGVNAYTGPTVVSAGTLELAGGGSVPGTTAVTLASAGAIFNISGISASSQNIGSLAGVAGSVVVLGAKSLNVGGDNTSTVFAGDVSGAGSLTKSGTGTLALAGTNGYIGGTTVAEGVLSFRTKAAFPATGQVNVAAAAGLALGVGGTGFFGAGDVDALFGGTFANVSMAGGSLVGIDTAQGSFTYSSNTPAVNLGLVKVGPNTLTLTDANSHTGGTVVAEGVLTIGSTGALPGWSLEGSYTVADGAVLAVGNGVTEQDFHTIRTLTANFGPGAATGIDTSEADRTFASSITGELPLVKLGSNTLTLTANNGHTGDTIVREGTLGLHATSGRAVPNDVILDGGNVTFDRNNQIGDDANVTIVAGHLNSTTGTSTDRRNDHTETLGSVTATGGSFQTGTGSKWTITGHGDFTGGSGNTKLVANSGTELAFGGLTLTDLTSVGVAPNNGFTIYGDRTTLTTVSVGPGGLTLNNSKIGMQLGSASNAGNALILGGDVAVTGTSTIQRVSTLGVDRRFIWLNNTADPVTRTFDVAPGGSLWTDAIVTDGDSGEFDEGGLAVPAGAGSIVKTGFGALTLAADNTYTGTTTVLAGMLEVTGSLAGNGSADVRVASAGTAFDGTAPSIVRRVVGEGSLAGLGSQIVGEPRLAGFHTEAELLAGVNHSGGALDVGMAWRMFGDGEAQGTAPYLRPVSDVLRLTGMAGDSEPTDPFVLQMSYDASLVTPATEGGLHLAWLDGTQWVNAVAGNFGAGTEVVERYWGSWDEFVTEYSSDLNVHLGSWGVDTGNAVVWALLDHNSQFGILVPEPGSVVLLVFGVLGLLAFGRRRFRV
ncbi:MAG: autotransporter-associated beta strand repeat-containing protein [Thermoguttaceae bacterium]|jgi:autotransporter-associated beta strand protein|nr:autotransporter-associated beta strand repeat-containing protein [Thermoguttaceae bacterium]